MRFGRWAPPRQSATTSAIIAAAGASGCFSELRALLLGDNAVQSWAAVDALSTFPRLEDARLTGNPFLGADPTYGRSEVCCTGRRALDGRVLVNSTNHLPIVHRALANS